MATAVKTYKKGEEVFNQDDEVETHAFIVEVKAASRQDAKYGLEIALDYEIHNSGNEYLKSAKAFVAE